ncbi:unnamed protein product, partial [Symbiodinium sp. KB8]
SVKLTGDKFLHNDNILVSGPPHVISVNITKVKFEATAGHGAAKVLFYENVGWFLEPQFSLDKAALRTLWQKTTCPEALTEDLRTFVVVTWFRLGPAARMCLVPVGSTGARMPKLPDKRFG